MSGRLMNPRPGDNSPLAEYTGNISHCWRCSHCKWTISPKSNAFAHGCPSIQWGRFHSYSGGGKVITAYALKEQEAPISEKAIESIFACTMCGACDTSCKTNNGELVEPLSVMHALRAHDVEEGKSPPQHLAMIENLRRTDNAAGHPQDDSMRWCEGLGLKNALVDRTEVLLHVGCENAFEPHLWAELRAIVALLQKAGIDFGVTFNAEASTGEDAYDLGFHAEAGRLARNMADLLAKSGAHAIVTCSTNSYAGIRNIWPRLGVAMPACGVTHITEYIDDLFERGLLEIDGRCEATVTYHDPCRLGRLSERYAPSKAGWTKVLNAMSIPDAPKNVLFGDGGLYEAPRKLLARIAGPGLVEMERNRVGAYCCGAAGGAKEAFPEFASFAAEQRLAEAQAAGAEVVATSCGSCQRHLSETAAASGRDVQVTGIFELLAARTAKATEGAR